MPVGDVHIRGAPQEECACEDGCASLSEVPLKLDSSEDRMIAQ